MAGDFKISCIYMNHFRTIENTVMMFDHRFRMVSRVGRWYIERTDKDIKSSPAGPFFYGDKVYSMSCIVGRNGEGKSSVVDFIRESFLMMLRDMGRDRVKLNPESGAITLTKGQRDFYHLEESTEFAVMFSLNGEDYYLTNLPNVTAEDAGIRPFSAKEKDPGHQADSCIVYFSMLRMRTGEARAERNIGRMRDEGTMREADVWSDTWDRNPYLSIAELFGPDTAEFSEEVIDDNRRRERINFDILFQLVFIHYREDLVRKCLGTDYTDRMQVSSIDLDWNLIMLRELGLGSTDTKIDTDNTRRILEDSLAYLRPFSSGQYSRFAILARLFWFLKGSGLFLKTPLFPLFFNSEEEFRLFEADCIGTSLNRGRNSILLFDEGDLFYHPEWQRTFVGDILEMVNKYADEPMQIIFTTNSPFMMSDMLREDIITLTRDKDKFNADVLTFGQNIHTLLAHKFFLNSTIGSVSEGVIGWLAGLLADPRDGIRALEERESERVYTEKDKKIYAAMKRDNLSQAEAEERYVNGAVYARFRGYCVHRGLDAGSDKSDFLESLISSIGEEIYRKRLRYRFKSYRERTLGFAGEISGEDAKRLIGILTRSTEYEKDPAVMTAVEQLKNRLR